MFKAGILICAFALLAWHYLDDLRSFVRKIGAAVKAKKMDKQLLKYCVLAMCCAITSAHYALEVVEKAQSTLFT